MSCSDCSALHGGNVNFKKNQGLKVEVSTKYIKKEDRLRMKSSTPEA